MPIFFLHIQDNGRIEDVEGGDYADLDAARKQAVTAAREIMAERLRAGEIIDGAAIEICDAEGALVELVRFRDVVRFS